MEREHIFRCSNPHSRSDVSTECVFVCLFQTPTLFVLCLVFPCHFLNSLTTGPQERVSQWYQLYPLERTSGTGSSHWTGPAVQTTGRSLYRLELWIVWIEFVVYYESIKRELKRRLIYEYRCDERLKTRVQGEMIFLFFYFRKKEKKNSGPS